MDRFDQYLADELYFDEAWFDANYDEIFTELIADGYSLTEATELAVEMLGDKYRSEVQH